MHELNSKFAHVASMAGRACGSPFAFIAACALIIGWIVTGPIFNFSDTWQLVINTATTIITFLMVFVIQNAQNRSDAALHLKLDELLRAIPRADTSLAISDLENASDDVIATLKQRFERLAEREAAQP